MLAQLWQHPTNLGRNQPVDQCVGPVQSRGHREKVISTAILEHFLAASTRPRGSAPLQILAAVFDKSVVVSSETILLTACSTDMHRARTVGV